jgi:hypothetical protein
MAHDFLSPALTLFQYSGAVVGGVRDHLVSWHRVAHFFIMVMTTLPAFTFQFWARFRPCRAI